MPMSKATIAGVLLAILLGTLAGTFLLVWDGIRRLLATDRDWNLGRRFQDDPANVDPLGY